MKLSIQPLISIIIPIYNGKKYLRQCIDSIINQTYQNWELLLMDDGSTDGSSAICDEYASHKRINVVHKHNSGQAMTRNLGISMAQGAYVSFVDCDDWLEPSMYETMIRVMQDKDADIAQCGYCKEYIGNRKIVNGNGLISVYSGEKALQLMLAEKIGSYLCFMIFKRDMLREPIANMKVFEDHATIFKWLSHAKRMVVIQQALYHYRQLQTSCLHTYSITKGECYFEAIKERYYYTLSEGLLKGKEKMLRVHYVRSCVKLCKDMARMDDYNSSHYRLIALVRQELIRFSPIKLAEIGLKHYFRLQLLMKSITLFVKFVRFSYAFQWSKSQEEKKMFAQVSNVNLRITFIVSRFLDGGIDTVLVDYLQALIASGNYQITLIIEQSMGELEVFMPNLPKEVKVRHLVESSILMRWRRKKIIGQIKLPIKVIDESMLSPIRRYIIKRDVKKIARKSDVVIDFDSCSYSFLDGLDVPKIAWFHFSFEEMLKHNRRRMLRIGHHLRHYDKIVTISKAMCEEGKQLFPELSEKMCIIYNAKNRNRLLQNATEPVDDERIRQPYILAVERLEESQKDLTTLLHAYQILRQRYKHQERLYLLGKGQSEVELRQLTKKLGICDSVVFLGFHANPYPWMKHACLMVHSAKLEGLPTVLIEGLMLDKLIVSTDCPTGPKEILNNGKAGLLIPVGDTKAMAEAIHQLLTNKQLQSDILQNVEIHRKNYMYESTLQQFDEIVKEVIKQRK